MASASTGEYSFALCLSHDVDRIYKTYQYLWNAVTQVNPRELAGLLSPENPYWTFTRVMDIESRLGVRSSFQVLDEMHITERPLREWATVTGWKLFGGRYDIDDVPLAATLRLLSEFGWEVGLHGSYTSVESPERLAIEKDRIESIVGAELVGNRQHYWRLAQPDTWRHLRDIGISYDMSLGSSTEIEFQHGYELLRPFDDEFVVFPWSLMDGAAMQSGDTHEEILSNCRAVLRNTSEHRSVLTLDWHAGDVFSSDYPGWAELYGRLIQEAQEMNAWVGPPGELYRALEHPTGTIDQALDTLAAEDTAHERPQAQRTAE